TVVAAEAVDTGLAEDDVLAVAATRAVVAGSHDHAVGPGLAAVDVVAAEAEHQVVERGSVPKIVALRANDRVLGRRTRRRVLLLRRLPKCHPGRDQAGNCSDGGGQRKNALGHCFSLCPAEGGTLVDWGSASW